jgi:hypothetical protein
MRKQEENSNARLAAELDFGALGEAEDVASLARSGSARFLVVLCEGFWLGLSADATRTLSISPSTARASNKDAKDEAAHV